MTNPLIEEVRAARAARAEALDFDPQKIADWARAAHAERQEKLESETVKEESNSTAGVSNDKPARAPLGSKF